MSKLGGIVLIVAGVGVAAYTLSSSGESALNASAPQKSEAAKPVQPQLSAEPAPAQPPTAPVAKTAIAPAIPTDNTSLPKPSSAVTVESVVTAMLSSHPPANEVHVHPLPAAPPKADAVRPALRAGPPLDRVGLTKELQRELKRVGCYNGDVSGVWTPVTRRSMKAFTERVNATLPVNEPDYILLTMVQGHLGQACGQSCPPGQGHAQDGRCLPSAIVAAAAKKVTVANSQIGADAKTADKQNKQGRAVAAAPVEPQPPPGGLMALAGPKQEPVQAATKSEPVSGQAPGKLGKQKSRHARSAKRTRYADRYYGPWEPWQLRYPSWVPW